MATEDNKKQKQVRVFVSRAFTLNRRDKDPVEFKAGANTVDAAVAEHPYVKHHIVDEMTVAADVADEALVKENEALKAEIEALKAEIEALKKENDALKAENGLFKATATAKK